MMMINKSIIFLLLCVATVRAVQTNITCTINEYVINQTCVLSNSTKLLIYSDNINHNNLFKYNDNITFTGHMNNNVINFTGYVIHNRQKNYLLNTQRQRRNFENRKIIVIVLRIILPSGEIHNGTKNLAYIGNIVDKKIFSSDPFSLRSFFSNCSYGKQHINIDANGKKDDYNNSNSDIFFVDIPHKCLSGMQYCNTLYNSSLCTDKEIYGWAEYAINYLTANRPNFNIKLWHHKLFIYPARGQVSCSFIGLGTASCDTQYCHSWYNHNYINNANSYAHEIGHNLGLAHAGNGMNGISGTNREYGDYSCSMGYCCGIRCYNSPHSVELGWLSSAQTITLDNFVNKSQVSVILRSMSIYNNGTIDIVPWKGINRYWLQMKTLHSLDVGLAGSKWINNVQIKEWSGLYNFERTDHLAFLHNNMTWIDGEKILMIRVNSIKNTFSRITIFKLPCGDNVCNINETFSMCPNDCSPCSHNPCLNNGTCVAFASNYNCSCPNDYFGKNCENKKTCLNCHKHAKCINFTCVCNVGYNGNGITCSDMNECNLTPCLRNNTYCVNTAGSFLCKCIEGFTRVNFVCSDINECNTTNKCDKNSKCINTNGSYMCECNVGYRGNGTVCNDINECTSSIGLMENCDKNAFCVNVEGSFSCFCNNGYIGNGILCNDVNECDMRIHNCQSVCVNTVGSFVCV